MVQYFFFLQLQLMYIKESQAQKVNSRFIIYFGSVEPCNLQCSCIVHVRSVRVGRGGNVLAACVCWQHVCAAAWGLTCVRLLTPCLEVEEAGSHHRVGSQGHRHRSQYSARGLQKWIHPQIQYCHLEPQKNSLKHNKDILISSNTVLLMFLITWKC